MANTSTAPLLQPPPVSMDDPGILRQWLLNLYTYVFQLTLATTSKQANSIATTAITSIVGSSPTTGTLVLKTYNSAGTLLSTQTITGI